MRGLLFGKLPTYKHVLQIFTHNASFRQWKKQILLSEKRENINHHTFSWSRERSEIENTWSQKKENSFVLVLLLCRIISTPAKSGVELRCWVFGVGLSILAATFLLFSTLYCCWFGVSSSSTNLSNSKRGFGPLKPTQRGENYIVLFLLLTARRCFFLTLWGNGQKFSFGSNAVQGSSSKGTCAEKIADLLTLAFATVCLVSDDKWKNPVQVLFWVGHVLFSDAAFQFPLECLNSPKKGLAV